MGKLQDFRALHELSDSVHQAAAPYLHSRPCATVKSSIPLPNGLQCTFNLSYGIKDIMLIGALTQSSVLLTGGTDMGKTTLAKLIMEGLFGEEESGWHRIDVDSDFGKDTYAQKDFSVIAEGKRSSEGFYTAMPWLQYPGIIIDEINRAHPALITKLMHVFDKDISLPDGSRVKTGHELENGTYQFQIAAINEGVGYSGTFDIDSALRRRTVIEIPIDIFPPTPADRQQLRERRERPAANPKNNLKTVLQLQDLIKSIPISPRADVFLGYLEAFDYCKNSLTGTKQSIPSSNGSIHQICTKPAETGGMGCEFLRSFSNDLCPYVRGITPGISTKLVHVAKGFAALRVNKFAEFLSLYVENQNDASKLTQATSPTTIKESLQRYAHVTYEGQALARAALTRYAQEIAIEQQDIEAAFGFVAYSKIGLASAYIAKHFQGNRYMAVTDFLTKASVKFQNGLDDPSCANLNELMASSADSERWQRFSTHAKNNNPWLLRALESYRGISANGRSDMNLYGG